MTENGRPTALTDEIRDKLVQALQLCNYRRQSADFAGIGERTLRRWMARGLAEKEGPYRELRAAVLEAESRAQILASGCIAKAIRAGDWKAAAWYLERKAPEQYAPRSKLFDPYRVLEILEDEGLVVDRDRALAALAESEPGVMAPERDDFDDITVSEEDKQALFRVLRAARGQRSNRELASGDGDA